MLSKLKHSLMKYLHRFNNRKKKNVEIALKINEPNPQIAKYSPKLTAYTYIEYIKLINQQLKIANEPLSDYFQLVQKSLDFNKYLSLDYIYIKPESAKKIAMNILKKRSWLSLCNKSIFLIRPNVKQLSNLQTIQLCCNFLTFLPDEICELKKLTRLLVSKNCIRKLPNNFGLLRNLRELNVASNLLTSLPHSFTSLRHLSFLLLNDNNISELSHELSGCFSLKYLFVARNKIQSLGAELMLLPFLRNIDIQGNPIEYKTKNDLKPKKLSSLQELCARKILNCSTHIPKNSSNYIKTLLVDVKECYFCGGSFFDNWCEVDLYKVINETTITFKAKLCRPHFRDQSEYVSKLLYIGEHRMGYHLCNDNYPKISELFILTSYTPHKLVEINKYLRNRKSDKHEKAPLFTLIEGYETVINKDYIDYANILLRITYKDDCRYNDPI